MKEQMKLYVWHGVFRNYTDGIAFALARSEEEAIYEVARAMRKKSWTALEVLDELTENGRLRVHEVSHPVGFGIEGGG